MATDPASAPLTQRVSLLPAPPQVYWIGPLSGGVLAGISHEFFFAQNASRQRLVACLTCKDVVMVETTSVSRSSLSTVTQNAGRAKQTNKVDGN